MSRVAWPAVLRSFWRLQGMTAWPHSLPGSSQLTESSNATCASSGSPACASTMASSYLACPSA